MSGLAERSDQAQAHVDALLIDGRVQRVNERAAGPQAGRGGLDLEEPKLGHHARFEHDQDVGRSDQLGKETEMMDCERVSPAQSASNAPRGR